MNRLPFGPHSGEPLDSIPDEYLFELVERQTRVVKPLRLWPQLSAAIDAELERRGVERRERRRAA